MQRFIRNIKEIRFKLKLQRLGFRISKREYQCSLENLHEILNEEKDNALILLLAYKRMILNSLQAEHMCSSFFTRRNEATGIRYSYLPIDYLDLAGNKKSLVSTDRIWVDLNKQIMLSTPWNYERFLKVLKRKGKFKFDRLNHIGLYYSNFDFGLMTNGLHSSSEAILNNKQGCIEVKYIDTDELLDCVYTDGIYWYNIFDDSINQIVIDYRVATLFEIIKAIRNFKLEDV